MFGVPTCGSGSTFVGPSDSEPVGPDCPYLGPVGPSDSAPVGPDDPYVGPVGLCGTLSHLTWNLLARMARMLARVGRCPPLTVGLCGMLSPPDPVAEGPVGLCPHPILPAPMAERSNT